MAEITPLTARSVAAWMALCARRPRLILIAVAAVVLLGGLGAARLGVDSDSSGMIARDLPAQMRTAALNTAFPALRKSIVIVVRGSQPDAVDRAVRILAAELMSRAEAIDGVFAPSADRYLRAHGWMYGSIDAVDSRLTRLSGAANLLADLRADRTVDGLLPTLGRAATLTARSGRDPAVLDPFFRDLTRAFDAATDETPVPALSWRAIAGDAATSTLRTITVRPRADTTRLNPARPALDAVAEAVDRVRIAQPGIEIGVTGEPALRAEELRTVTERLALSLVLSLGLVAAILRVGLGTTARAALAIGTLLVTLVLSAGAAWALVGDLNLISVAFIVLMVGLGIDFAVHLLAHMTEPGGADDPAARAGDTGRATGGALALSAMTTAAAFLAFVPTDFAGLAQLGLIGAAGVLIAFGVAVTVVPATIALLPGITRSGPTRTRLGTARPRLWPAVAGAVLASLFVVPALGARFDPDPMGLRDRTLPAAASFGWLTEDAERTPYRASVLTATAAAAQDAADRLATLPEVARATTLAALVPQDQDLKLDLLDLAAPSIEYILDGTPAALTEAPEDVPAALRSLGTDAAGALADALERYDRVRDAGRDARLSEAVFRYFPDLLDDLDAMLSADRVTAATLPDALRERFVGTDGSQRVEIAAAEDLRDPDALARFAEAVLAVAPEAAGGPVQLHAAGRTVSNAILTATLTALGLTGLLAALATRRLRDVVAILVPLALAGIVTAGAATLMGLAFNYANVIVVPLMIGIGVDSGIHLAFRARQSTGAHVFATSTPRAILVSAATTMAAFGTLALSAHPGTASMGILLFIAMAAAVGLVMAMTPVLIGRGR